MEKIKKEISRVGFYPIVLEKDEAEELENQPEKMGIRFEQEMCQRVHEWMALAEEKLGPRKATLYFMAGNDDLYSIDEVIAEYKSIRNPDNARFEIEGGYEIVGLSNANMTPWMCARDVEEDELARKLDAKVIVWHDYGTEPGVTKAVDEEKDVIRVLRTKVAYWIRGS